MVGKTPFASVNLIIPFLQILGVGGSALVLPVICIIVMPMIRGLDGV